MFSICHIATNVGTIFLLWIKVSINVCVLLKFSETLLDSWIVCNRFGLYIFVIIQKKMKRMEKVKPRIMKSLNLDILFVLKPLFSFVP